jgi:hypothetical protein
MVFLQLWRQSPIHAIRLTANRRPPEPVWISEKPGPQEPSPLYYRGLLYAYGVLVCLDAKTGKEIYRQRLGGAANSYLVASGGRIYLSNNDGATFVVSAGREFALLATNQFGERITASPRPPETGCITARTRTYIALRRIPRDKCWYSRIRSLTATRTRDIIGAFLSGTGLP